MKREYYNQHSDVLNKNMSMIVYGEGGYPAIAFQAQDAKSNNFEDFGMIDALAPFIDEGRIQVFSVDNLDEQSWSDQGATTAPVKGAIDSSRLYGQPMRAYRCPICGGWHLTSQEMPEFQPMAVAA